MKRLFTIITCTLITLGASAQEFVIRGRLEGLKVGTSLGVIPAERALDFDAGKSNADADAFESGDSTEMQYEDKVIAEATVTEDGVFLIRGHVDRPQLVTLITNNLSLINQQNQEKGTEKDFTGVHWTYTPIFLENAEYVISAPKYELLSNDPITDQCIISGGEAQNDFNAYNLMLRAAGEEADRDAIAFDFMKAHPTSVVSVYLADKMLDAGSDLTSDAIKRIGQSVTGCPSDPQRYAKFSKRVETVLLTAAGNPVVDLQLATPDGTVKRLVDVIPQGKTVLVDFWASWCGICRMYTPSFKEMYAKYPRQQLEIISVSCDKSLERWHRAMEKDDMPWAQYVLTDQGYTDFFAKYQTSGVPYLLLVGPDGKVICSPGGPEEVEERIKTRF